MASSLTLLTSEFHCPCSLSVFYRVLELDMGQLYELCPLSGPRWEELPCVLWATGWAPCRAEREDVLARSRVLLLPESGEWGEDALQQLIEWNGQDVASAWLPRHLISLPPSQDYAKICFAPSHTWPKKEYLCLLYDLFLALKPLLLPKKGF